MAVSRYYSSSAVQTALSGGISPSATTMSVGTVSGLPIQYPFTLSIDADNSNKEIVKVTAAVGLVLTVVRAQDGTAGVAHSLGAAVSHDHSAQDFRESREHENATSNVHGVTGALVGTTTAQTLTNKDLSDPSNNLGLPTGTVTLTGTQTLTNKTLTAPTINTPAINDGVYKKSTNDLTLPYSAANLAGLPTTGVSNGELGATADGKLYQRRSGAWVDIGSAAAVFSAVTSSGTSGTTARSVEGASHGNGLATLRGTWKPNISYTVTSGLIANYGNLKIGTTLSAGLTPNKHTGIVAALTQSGDKYPLIGHIETNGDIYVEFCPLNNSITSADTISFNITYSV